MGIESPVHLLFIGAVALLVLGPKRLPEVARALGKGLREFREAMGEQPTVRPAPAEGAPAATQPDGSASASTGLGGVYDLAPPPVVQSDPAVQAVAPVSVAQIDPAVQAVAPVSVAQSDPGARPDRPASVDPGCGR